ncbi:MAG: histidine kinase [Eubacteriales bacterium]|nr:histidine kinase [Eubacteriales bacterium]
MMKRFLYGFKKQFFLYTAAIMLVFLAAISVIFARTASRNIRELALQSYATSNEQHLLNFQKNYESLSSLTQSYVLNTYIQRALSSGTLTYTDRKYITSSLRYPNNDLVESAFYINNDSEIFYSSLDVRRIALNQELLALFSSAVEETYSRPVLLSLSKEYGENAGLYIIRKIRHLEINCPPGLLVLRVSERFYNSIFSDNGFQKEAILLLLEPDSALCYAQNTTAFAVPDSEMLVKSCAAFAEPYGIQNGQYFFCRQDAETGFWLLCVIPKPIIAAYSESFYRTLLFLSLFLLLILTPFIYLAAGHFTRPVRKLSETMSAFSVENMGKKIQTSTNTELDTISESYNMMVRNIQELMQALKKEQEILRANEYSLLLHQINPHFLYNTLDNIHMLARMHGDSTTVQLISSLTKLLRISLSNGHEIIPLAQELEHIRCYLEIEQIRTVRLFDFWIDSPEELDEVMIPKLILQPIVENGIKYGFAELEEGGVITVQVRRVGGNLWISVFNNGEGISEEAMRRLNGLSGMNLEEIAQEFPQTAGGYGVANVVCRLKLRYQERFVLYYSNQGGTLCTMVLPG